MDSPSDRILDTQDDYRTLFESAPDLMYTHDLNGVLLRVNPAFERVTGYSSKEVTGRNFFDLVAPADREEARQKVIARLGGEGKSPFVLTLITKQGHAVKLEVATNLQFRNGQPNGVQGFARDVSQVVTFTRYLQLLHRLSTTNYQKLETLLDDYLATGCEIFGVQRGVITSLARGPLKIFGEADHDPIALEVARSRQTLSLDANGEPPYYLGTPLVIGRAVYGVLGFWSADPSVPRREHPQAREVIELMAKSIAAAIHQRQLTDQLAHQANHDALTGLPNRLTLLRELNAALDHSVKTGDPLGVVFIDLDRFKQINDTLGHDVGDAVLQQIGRRLRESLRPGDTLARIGGDEFTAIVKGCETMEHLAMSARELTAAIRKPCRAAGRELFVTASVGISVFPKDGIDSATLLRNADIAMYTAKHRTRNDLHFFTEGARDGARKRLELETRLRRALERNELMIHYQPQVELSGGLAGFEALLVWESPDLGRISPTEFIPIAEDTGMIVPIGTWVLRESCRQMAEWRRAGLASVPVSVNVSALQFADPAFTCLVSSVLSETGIPAGALELELTESLIMRDIDASAALMLELQRTGVRIAIDDFGTGYSSLSYLRRLPANTIKIDQSFLQESEFGPASLALIRAIVVLAHNIGLIVTAEGVETNHQLEIVRQAGCDKVQGHMFGAGLARDAAEDLLRDPAHLAGVAGFV
jgi:diguanylate cyclase (GGDEF)-like protein/PAS domain S-box-containing protein